MLLVESTGASVRRIVFSKSAQVKCKAPSGNPAAGVKSSRAAASATEPGKSAPDGPTVRLRPSQIGTAGRIRRFLGGTFQAIRS